MKKVLFSLMAIVSVLFTTVCLTSCVKSEEIIAPNETKYTYTFKVEYATKNPSNKADIEDLNKHVEEQNKNIEAFQTVHLTSLSAAAHWMNVIENQSSKMQEMIDNAAKTTGDQTLTMTIQMFQDGKEFKSRTWTPNPLIFL